MAKKKKKRRSFQTEEPCAACETESFQRCFHHVKHRGSGGLDSPWNMMPLCQKHHNEIHLWNNTKFANEYENVKAWFIANDWSFSETYQKWIH